MGLESYSTSDLILGQVPQRMLEQLDTLLSVIGQGELVARSIEGAGFVELAAALDVLGLLTDGSRQFPESLLPLAVALESFRHPSDSVGPYGRVRPGPQR